MGENPVLEGVAVVGGESYFVLILHQSVLSNEAMIYYIIFVILLDWSTPICFPIINISPAFFPLLLLYNVFL